MSAINIAVNLVGNNRTGGAFGSMGADMLSLSSRARSLGKAFNDLSGTTKLAMGAALGAGLAFKAFITPVEDGFNAAADLEVSLLQVKQAAQATTDAMPYLTSAINDLGIKTVYSSDEAAQAFARLIRSGFSVSQVMYGAGAAAGEYRSHAYDATEATHGLGFEALALGQALKMDATDGANLAAAALQMYRQQVQAAKDPTAEASRIVSDLAGAYQNGAKDGADLLRFLQQVGPTASATGVSFQDLVTTGDVLAQSMGSMGAAGTRLRYFLSSLIHPTAAQALELANLGIVTASTGAGMQAFEQRLVKAGGATKDNIKAWAGSVTGLQNMFAAAKGVGLIGLDTTFSDWAIKNGYLNSVLYDSSGAFKGMKNAVDVLNQAMRDKTPQERMAALNQLFNVRGGDAGKILASLGTFDAQYRAIWDRIGKTDVVSMAMQRLDTFRGATEAFADSVKSSLAVAFMGLLPTITRFVNVLNNLLEVFINAPASVHTAVAVFLLAGVAIAGLSTVVFGAVAVVGLVGPALAAMGIGAGAVAPLILGVVGALGLIPVAAAGVAVGLGHTDTALDKMRDAAGFVRDHVAQLAGLLAGAGTAAFLVFGGRAGTAVTVMQGLGRVLQTAGGALRAALPLLKNLADYAVLAAQNIGPILGAALRALGGVLPAVAGWLSTFAGWLESAGIYAVAFVRSLPLLLTNLGGLSGIWAALSGSIGEGVGALAAFLAPAAAVVGVALLIAAAVVGVVLVFRQWWDTSAKFRAVIQDLLGRLQGLGTLLMGQFKQAWQAVQDAMKGLQPTLVQVGQLWETLKPVLTVIGGIIIVVLVGALGILVAALRGVISALGPLLSGIIQAFAGVVRVVVGVVQVIVGIVQIFVGLIKVLFTGDWTTLHDGLMTLWHGVQNIVGGLVDTVVGLFKGLVGGVIGLITGFVGGLIDWFTHLWDVLVGHSIVPDLIRAIIKWFLSLPGVIVAAIVRFVGDMVANFVNLSVRVLVTINALVNLAVALFDGWKARVLSTVARLVTDFLGLILTLEQRLLATINAMVTLAIAYFNHWRSEGVAIFVSTATSIVVAAMSLKDRVVKTIGDLLAAILSKAGAIKDGLLKPFQGARDTIGGVVKALANNMRNPLNAAIHGFQDMANGFGSAIDGVASKIGAGNPIPRIYLPMIPAFANGTRGFGGGLALVGERGAEFAMLGGRRPALLGRDGPEVRHLPPGTSVLPAGPTLDLLGGHLAIPGFAGGIGDVLGAIGNALGDVLDWASKPASWVVDTALKAVGFKGAGGLPGVLGHVGGAAGGALKDAAVKWVTAARDKFLSAEAGAGGIGTAVGLLPGFPSINQLALRDINRTFDCVPSSVTAGASWVLHRLLDASQVKAAVYGAGYTGGQSTDRYIPYMARLGVKIGKQFGSGNALVRDVETGIATGHPVVATIPSDWNNAGSGGPTHEVVFAGQDRAKGLITAMNPWRGFWQTESAAWWAPRLRENAVYPMGHMANGGVIDEPSLGIGLLSGRRWTMGEREAELVTPFSRLGAGGGAGGGGRTGTVVIQNKIGGKHVGSLVLDLATLELRQVGANRMGR